MSDLEENIILENSIKCVTQYPVAYDSPDHIVPVGTKQDNTTNIKFIEEVEGFFNKKIKYLDCGCAGGGFVVDFAKRGHFSVGLEGSDYGMKNKLHNWPLYGNKFLFTCDITKPFKILKNDNVVKFNLITAWEMLEHLEENDIKNFLNCVMPMLDEAGLFVCSINTTEDFRTTKDGETIKLHQTVKSEEYWREVILKDYFVDSYPYNTIGRITPGSFYISIKNKLQGL